MRYKIGEHGTPVPSREIEAKSKGSGPVDTRKMTEEEYIKYFGEPFKPVLNRDGQEVKKPISHRGGFGEMAPKPKYTHITKELLETEFAKGKSARQIEREQGMAPSTIYQHMKLLGVKNPNGRGRPANRPEEVKPVEKKVEVVTPKLEPLPDKTDLGEISHKTEEKPVEVVKSEAKAEYKVSHDPVNSPSHYTAGGIEVIEIMKAKLTPEQFEGYLRGNLMKYTMRDQYKGGLEDLKKARAYLNWLIEEVEAK